MASTERSSSHLDTTAISASPDATPSYDLVSIGFGAAQLATAIANQETRKPLSTLYLERKPSFSWHTGSHTARTRMEIPFVYDLATLRNPRTSFSYVNYLLEKKRLVEFANSDRLNPLREEFDDYMRWCAEKFKDQVRYGSEVVGVTPEMDNGVAKGWRVAVRDSQGKTYAVRARNIVAPSPSQQKPVASPPLTTIDFLSGQRIIPMNEYPARREELRGANEPRLNISVIGSGPQMAEVLNDILSCPRLGNITVVTEDESLAPLTVLNDQEPAQPQLCSIWAKPTADKKLSVAGASGLVQEIYMRGYEKHVRTKGEYRLRVLIGRDARATCSKSDVIIRDTAVSSMSTGSLLESLDGLILGCHQRSESLEEVQFKRGAVADGCRLWLVSSKSEGGRTLAKDVALAAGEVVRKVSSVAQASQAGVVQVQARM
ncbi:hypothetical protein IAQ61_010892 [Plenodomus lingam]|uniref:L-ornithine N(5)-monooxygenase [NAD(P)H] n=1 Tax=Leptosphaeria maculans (strain JN3 / isolate v23.1.3 / race Av1-4-5-6-7-8) TaxID=985895 RepID=E4ZJD5_LEPMJ|nr:predicted protein [Plenodomus lingam JN3]KAH9861155.1 hypothetical protein IAQ61_010892 [Plenodomus lingam]CBX91566.1 predicted protein [Plenodomus lingam JN3]